jgi:uncharacterized RDD family membrane protein YckC
MQTEKTNILTIKTPEGITFSLNLAGPVSRFIAWAIDVMTISVVMSILQILLALFIAWAIDVMTISVVMSILQILLALFGLISADLAYAIAILLYFTVRIGYGIFFEWYWQGQTLGKKLLRLRVMDEQGLRLQFSQIVIRNLLRAVDSLPGLYLVGGLVTVISRPTPLLSGIRESLNRI